MAVADGFAADLEDVWFRGWLSLLVADGLQDWYREGRCVECFEHSRDGVQLVCFRFEVKGKGKIYSVYYPAKDVPFDFVTTAPASECRLQDGDEKLISFALANFLHGGNQS